MNVSIVTIMLKT